ncbi:MAG: FtsX-like permease family protein [Polyangiaceae bacterium]|nr:FtsX-like permease family protein [Polyangiaceae bacterium]
MELGPTLRAMLRNKLRFGLIAAQIAVTLAIVANCVTLIQDARRRMRYPKAFDEDNLILVEIPCQDTALRDDRRRNLWARENLERLREIPGVRAVTSTHFTPFYGSRRGSLKAAGSDAAMTPISFFRADERFPDALGAELDEGEWFSREQVELQEESLLASLTTKRPDGKAREPIVVDAVISRALGQHFFGEGPLVGKMLEDPDGYFYRIVGVLGRYYSPTYSNVHPEHAIFVPGISHHYHLGAKFIARAEPGQAAIVARRIEQKLSETFDLAYNSVWLMSAAKDITLGPQQMTEALMGLLVILLLFVASLGIAGLTSFSVTERTRQIGTRRALGAAATDILSYFLTESGLVTAVGLFVGAGLAVLLNMVLLTVYTDAKLGLDIMAASALLLWIVGLGAALPPALRGARISPAIATRNV